MFSLIKSIKDLYDLERRMRQVDSGRQNLYAIGSQGIFTR
jgi:hypothetical protein